jgi:hypothetical protein
MSQSIPEPHTPPDPQKSDSDTASYKQRMGGDDPPAPRGGANPRLPHERDESAIATGNRHDEKPMPSDRQISQAGEDAEHGLVDTDRRGVPDDLPKRRTT